MITSTDADIRNRLNKVKNRFAILPNEIKGSTGRFSNAIATELVKRAKAYYKDFEAEVNTYDHQDRSGTRIYKEITDDGYVVIASGPQVVYDEYGTGDRGAGRPHPYKPSYLKGYNTGPKIITSKTGHYWNYYSTELGQVVRSSGVPSGHFMYDAFNDVAGVISSNICLQGLRSTVKSTLSGEKPDAFTADLLKEIGE